MDIQIMRKEIAKVYPGDRWATKVKNMGAAQVLAVYHNFLKNNRFEGSKVTPERGTRRTVGIYEDSDFFGKQISLDEYMVGVDLASGPDWTVIRSKVKPEKYDHVIRTFYLKNGDVISWSQSQIDEEKAIFDYYQRWIVYAKSICVDLSQVLHDHHTEYIIYKKRR